RRPFPGTALSKLFFCNLWSMSVILMPGQQRVRIAGGRGKEVRNERIYTPKEQGICARSVRDPVQQEGLRRGREVLVVKLYSTQRAYTARERRALRPGKTCPARDEI